MAGVEVKFSISGIDQVTQALERIEAAALDELRAATPAEASALLQRAQQTVPRLSGELAASAEIATGTDGSAVTEAAVGYTDGKAAAVHEGVHHGHHVPGTRGFKWLERAHDEGADESLERIAERLRGVLGG
jgi:acyl-CoA reductase-like NAD-dependent aldehyde dehydrogenase